MCFIDFFKVFHCLDHLREGPVVCWKLNKVGWNPLRQWSRVVACISLCGQIRARWPGYSLWILYDNLKRVVICNELFLNVAEWGIWNT